VKAAVLTDFDGTITRPDVAEDLLRRFAPATWWDLELLHRARKIGMRETLARQFDLVRATEAELLRHVDEHAALDESFRDFVGFCAEASIRLEIVSEGIDFYVDFLLRKWGLDIPYRTNRATFTGGGMKIGYPWADATCTLCGTCKLRRLFELRVAGHRIAYVGDGTSDICPAIEADLVFAKDELARLCLEEEIDFIPFDRFSDVQRGLEGWR
jgi:2-hydroxy-3-keto-5-methylthiopentenyl-1-phosphate phosphatase